MNPHPKLSAIKQRLAAATPGPWRSNEEHELHDGPCVDTMTGEYICTTATDGTGLGLADAQLIANAPEDLRCLIEALECALGALDDCAHNCSDPTDHWPTEAQSALSQVARILGDDGGKTE